MQVSEENDTKYIDKSEQRLGLVHIASQVYAANLYWHVTSFSKIGLADVKEQAVLLNTNLLCANKLPLGMGVQYGLAEETLSHVVGQKVLATAFAKKNKGKTILGCWESDENLWVCVGVRDDGVILIDKIHATEKAALREFMNVVLLDKWDGIYCPEHWEIANSSHQADITAFLSKSTTIIPIARSKKFKLVIAGAIVLLIIGLLCGVQYRKNYLYQQAMLKMQKKLLQEELANKNHPTPVKSAPWSGLITPSSFVSSCLEGVKKIQLELFSYPGWSVDQNNISCKGSTLSVSIDKKNGTTYWLKLINKQLPYPATLTLSSDENSALLSWSLDKLKQYSKQPLPTLLTQNILKNRLKDDFEEAFTDINFSEDNTTQTESNTSNDNLPIKINFNFQTSNSPNLFLPILEQINGIIIDSMTLSLAQKTSQFTFIVNGYFFAKKQV